MYFENLIPACFFRDILDANYDKEESWKFQYVCKGPNRAKQKKVYYVYGKGLRDNPTNPGNVL